MSHTNLEKPLYPEKELQAAPTGHNPPPSLFPNIHTPLVSQPQPLPVEATPPVFKPAVNPAPQPLHSQIPPLPSKPPKFPFPLKSLLIGVAAAAALSGGGCRVHTPSYQAGQTIKDCDVCPALVVVPPGSFMMGSNDYDGEKPVHQVNINYSLMVGKYEVTFAEWDACVDAGGCNYRPSDEGWGRGNRPVINVGWDDAQQYVGWLKQKTEKNYRLLSEAEWEYVARAGTNSRFSFGDNKAELGNYAWYDKNSGDKTHPVGEKRPNAFGLYDLHGNVWEWVEDCYQDGYNGAPTDGSAVRSNNCASYDQHGDVRERVEDCYKDIYSSALEDESIMQSSNCAFRVHRGGSWSYPSTSSRAAARSFFTSDYRISDHGFRIARTLP